MRSPNVELLYLVLVVMLLVASLTMAFMAFTKRELAAHQTWLLKWILPIGSGIAASAFIGSITVSSEDFGFGLAVSASSGCAVWLLAFVMLNWSDDRDGASAIIEYMKTL